MKRRPRHLLGLARCPRSAPSVGRIAAPAGTRMDGEAAVSLRGQVAARRGWLSPNRVPLVRGAGLLAAGLLAACASAPPTSQGQRPETPRPQRDSGPAKPPPHLADLPDPPLRAVTKSKRGNSSYVVFGKRYEVLASAAGYRREGKASWYGKKFHGRTTSSGEVYDMYQLTAAHRSLPIPTYVRVTNLDNGRRTIVRVNDRGPFHPDRIIDLSYAGAVKLGFQDKGVANVRVESVLPAAAATRPSGRFFVYAGPFRDWRGANTTHADVRALVAEPTKVVRRDGTLRVRVGPVATRRDAERLRALLAFQKAPIQQPIIVEE